MTKNSKTLMWAATALGMGLAGTAFAGTLDDVKARGHVLCGTSEGVAGFSAPNNDGVWVGFDVDVCRAVSSAIFGDPEYV